VVCSGLRFSGIPLLRGTRQIHGGYMFGMIIVKYTFTALHYFFIGLIGNIIVKLSVSRPKNVSKTQRFVASATHGTR